MNKRYIDNIIYPIITVSIIVALWAISARSVNVDIILPTPWATVIRFIELIGESRFYMALLNTLGRSLISFSIAIALALTLSICSIFIEPFRRIVDPIIVILRSTPTMSIILLTLIWMRSATGAMFIAFLITFPLLYTAFYTGFNIVPKDLKEISDIYKVSMYDKITRLYIPSAMPTIFGALRSSISLNLKVLIAAEVMSQTRDSMGFYMQRSMVYFETAELISWTIAAIIMSYLLELIVEIIRRKVIRWKI